MLEITIGVILILVSIFLIVAVLMQSSKNSRLSGAIAGGAETFFGKAKGKTLDKKLNKLTIIIAIVFAVIVLALYAIQPGKAKISFDYDALEQYIEGVKDGSIEVTVSDEHSDEDSTDDSSEDDGDSENAESGDDTGSGDESSGDESSSDEGNSDESSSGESSSENSDETASN